MILNAVSTPLAGQPASPSRLHPLCERFYSRLPAGEQVCQFFEHLTGVYFFLKDDQCRMIAFNSALLERLGISDAGQIVGATDFDLFPRRLAEQYLQDDAFVLKHGQPLIGKVEAWRNEQPIRTNKAPVRDGAGRVIGLMGSFQIHDARQPPPDSPDAEIRAAVAYIHTNLAERISVEQVAEHALVSVRQLRRKFHKAFGMSVQEYLIKCRVETAREALSHSDATLSEIAHDCGFCDQSAFTHHFRRRTGLTPLRFRHEASASIGAS